MWDVAVDLVRFLILGAAQVCGGSLGTAILLVSLGVRVALLPLTLRMARQARAQQARMSKLKPKLEALRLRHAKDPARQWRETQALMRAHNIRFLTPTGMVSFAIQMPLLGALFSATRQGLGDKIRFLWIADLARPDAAIALVVSAMTAAVTAGAVAGSGEATATVNVVPIITVIVATGTLLFLWSASSAVALSVGAGTAVSALQSWMLARDRVAGVDAVQRR